MSLYDNTENNHHRDLLRDAQAILSASEQVETFRQRMVSYTDAFSVRDRGYFLPEEERQAKDLFGAYLRIRGALLEIAIRRRRLLAEPEPDHADFLIGLSAAGLLVSWSTELVERYQKVSVVRRKLNEADATFGIGLNQFETIRDALGDPDNLEPLGRALGIYRQHRESFSGSRQIPAVLTQQLMTIADGLADRFSESARTRLLGYARLEWRRLRRETTSPLADAVYALRSWVFEAVGNTWLAERPHLPQDHLDRFASIMQPGDFFIVRPEEKMSTVFLPGWWTHAAMYCGTAEQMAAIDCLHLRTKDMPEDLPIVIEALAAGVVINPLSDAMHVDHAAAIGLDVQLDQRRDILREAYRHHGKPYDFTFDFTRSDQLVCTELVYRALDGKAGIRINPVNRLGQPTVNADDFASLAIDPTLPTLNFLAGSSKNRWLDPTQIKDLHSL